MIESPSPRFAARVAVVAPILAVPAALIALAALIGWAFDLRTLISGLPGQQAMNPLTAIGILLAAIALSILGDGRIEGRLRGWGSTCAGLVAAIGVARLVTLASGVEPAPDRWLFASRLAAMDLPNRMGVGAAIALTCVGLALLTLDWRTRRGWRVADPLLFVAHLTVAVTLIGYGYRAPAMVGLAFNAACALWLLSLGALLSRPERGVIGLLLAESPGGAMARRLLPAAALFPILLGWVSLVGRHARLYGLELGTAILTMAIVALMVGLIWVTASQLDAAEVERRRIEAALDSSLARLDLMLELNMIGILTAKNNTIIEANAAFLDLVGYSAADLPLPSATITPPEWQGRNDVAVREIAERGVATPFEKEYVRKDGKRVQVLVGGAAIPGTEGEVMAFVVDLSGKKAVEREMEQLRVFLDSVVENLPNMVFVKDAAELRFVRFNRAGEQLLGFRREDLLGKNDLDFFPEEQARFFIDKDRAVLSRREPLDIPEEEIRTGSGEVRVLHTQKVPILDRDGKPLYLLGISEDITERKRAEREVARLNDGLRQRTAELEAVNRELEAFSYSVSHDLRAPLRHIDGFADLLIRHAGGTLDEKGRRHLETISQSAKSMGMLIDDLLAFSRMGRAEMRKMEVDLDELVGQVRRELESDVAGRNVRWTFGALPAVHGDRAMLRLVLTNLLANAVKYTRPRPEASIEVGSRRTPDSDVIYVRDNGVGFDMQYVHKLFGVFQRLHRDDEFEGTGIGLANVRRVIQRHGGRVWAEGQIDGGATFFVALPRTPAADDIREAA